MAGLFDNARPLDRYRILLAPDQGWQYGTGILPMKSRTPLDPIYGAPQIMETEFAWAIPGMAREMAGSLLNVLEAPRTGVMPGSGDAINALSLLSLPAFRAPRPGPPPLAKRSVLSYNPPNRPPRPFTKDYPDGTQVEAGRRLTHDIEGRPLEVGGRIVGRRVAGGADEAVSPTEFDAIAKEATARGAETVPGRQIGGDAGRYVETRDRRSGKVTDRAILLSEDLTDAQLSRVYGHEIGHVIDQLAGEIPVKGLTKELRSVYNTLNNPNRDRRSGDEAASWGGTWGPKAEGYKGADVARELMAEAIRAYMVNPNYLKAEAPKVAAAIRKHVNANPRAKKIIQFNTAAPPPGLFSPQQPQMRIPRSLLDDAA
jgi:hypothetical protein